MKTFIQSQESMAYNLNGTGKTLSDVTTALNSTLSRTGIVQQQKVYENLQSLVRAGIVNNAEQRAYLQTLSQDLGMIFDVQNGSLTRLIRLQQTDLSSHRMAIENSLHEFLNINFQTSEYIHHGFEKVSETLLEAQSLMSNNAAVALEASVQKWMGAMSSAGFSEETISSLAKAINDLGSGNYEMLTGNTGMLINMAASRAGLSIGDLLHNGVTGSNAELLMESLVRYMTEINSGNSNVVKSAYSKIFGFNVSDLAATSNLGDKVLKGIDDTQIGTNISELLAATNHYVYTTTKISNLLENFKYGWATGIASNPNQYMAYKVTEMTSQILSPLVGPLLEMIPVVGTGLRFGVENAPLIAAIGMGLYNGGDAKKLAKSIQGGGSVNILGSLFNTLFTGGNGENEAAWIYEALGKGGMNFFDKGVTGVTGNLFRFSNRTGKGNSGSAFLGDDLGSSTSATTETKFVDTDGQENKTLNDIYNRLTDTVNAIVNLPNQPFGTVTKIAEAGNVVSIGQDSQLMQDMVTYMAMNVQNIYSLLVARFTQSGNANVVDTNTMNWNHPFDWMYTTIGGNA